MTALLTALGERVPASSVAAARELTKRHEEVLVGTPAEVASHLDRPRGEFTVVISDLPRPQTSGTDLDVEALLAAGRGEGLSDRSLVALLRATGLNRRDAYRRVEAHRSE
jgi:16S rRNA C1402 (ribose-2'-O) methylase RsmI